MDGGEYEFLLLGGWENFIEVNRNAERDEKKAANTRAYPVGGLKGWWSDEL